MLPLGSTGTEWQRCCLSAGLTQRTRMQQGGEGQASASPSPWDSNALSTAGAAKTRGRLVLGWEQCPPRAHGKLLKREHLLLQHFGLSAPARTVTLPSIKAEEQSAAALAALHVCLVVVLHKLRRRHSLCSALQGSWLRLTTPPVTPEQELNTEHPRIKAKR